MHLHCTAEELADGDNADANTRIERLLLPMIEEPRIDRAREVLNHRTQAARLVFCCLAQADVIACLRTMDLFGIQFAEIIGDWIESPDTSEGARSYITLRLWPSVHSCLSWMNKAPEL